MVSVPRLTSTRLRSPWARESSTVAADNASTESEPFCWAVRSAFCALTSATIPHTDTPNTATVATTSGTLRIRRLIRVTYHCVSRSRISAAAPATTNVTSVEVAVPVR